MAFFVYGFRGCILFVYGYSTDMDRTSCKPSTGMNIARGAGRATQKYSPNHFPNTIWSSAASFSKRPPLLPCLIVRTLCMALNYDTSIFALQKDMTNQLAIISFKCFLFDFGLRFIFSQFYFLLSYKQP